MGYSENAKAAYGVTCEWIGCGWNMGWCDVHHLNYQEHQALEDQMRACVKKNDMNTLDALQARALTQGYGYFNFKERQLPKKDGIENLSVLCPNHHRYIHTIDLGLKALIYLPERKEE